jgi:hypothetical protein
MTEWPATPSPECRGGPRHDGAGIALVIPAPYSGPVP